MRRRMTERCDPRELHAVRLDAGKGLVLEHLFD
jgi:hypothetical protein